MMSMIKDNGRKDDLGLSYNRDYDY